MTLSTACACSEHAPGVPLEQIDIPGGADDVTLAKEPRRTFS
jgi:hypothetical protein